MAHDASVNALGWRNAEPEDCEEIVLTQGLPASYSVLQLASCSDDHSVRIYNMPIIL